MITTKTAGHTPGPWTTAQLYTGPRKYVVGPDKITIARCGHPARTDAEAEANSRLIAAAPELLAALTDMVLGCEMQGVYLLGHAVARAAIAKAEGLGE